MKLKKFFNMIEVTLALAVVGIGMAGIMSMFPVAVQSSKNAIADNYSSDVVLQVQTLLTAYAKKDWAGFTSAFPDKDHIPTINDSMTVTSSWSSPLANSSIYTTTPAGAGIWGVKLNTDFNAHVKIWYDTVSDFNYNKTWGTIPDSYARTIFIELSWPVQVPYSKREKKTFSFVVFKEN